MKLFIAILFLCIILAAGCISSSLSEEGATHTTSVPLSPGHAATSEDLDDYMTALADAGRFTGAVLVARDDTVLLSKGYGMANREFSVPNTPETVFPIGSNTKQFTAAAVMKLQEEGRLNVTDPISWYIPGSPPQWADIRIYHLLNHTSGIPSDSGWLITDPTDIPLPDLVHRFSDLPLTFEPGTGYTYSNNGYITLSSIIEQASGQTYNAYLREKIFEPLGMTRTGQDNARDVFPHRAGGYTTMGGEYIHYELLNIHNSYGAGSLHSTIEDLHRWEQAFHTPGAILSARSLDDMSRYDYGIGTAELNNRTLMGHGGRCFGFISYTLYYPAEDVTILFLSNHDRTPMVTLPRDLSAMVFDEPCSLPQRIHRTAIPLPADAHEEYTGIYAPIWEETWTYTVFTDGSRLLYTSVVPPETVELLFEGNDTFFVTPESKDSFIFTRDDAGEVDGMVMYTMEGNSDEAVKIS